MLKFRRRSCEKEADERMIELISNETGLCREAALIMWQRGITTIADAGEFLNPDVGQIHDPYLLPDMKASVERINTAVSEGEIVTVFCDYDADGTCGGSALFLHLRSMGLSVNIMSPNRHKEGYGLSEAAVSTADENDSTLIITVDCGITNIEEVEFAKSIGIDVIVTDHHECAEQLPDTPYIINPKRQDSVYPYGSLAGCGVAFKLIQALSGLDAAMQYIDLVAVGTVTDIVPLLGENRALVHFGIEKLKAEPSAGVEALSRIAGIRINSAVGVSFGLGPRINAAGRMDTAHLAIDILSADRKSRELDEKAKQLCRLNDQRRKEVDDITVSAEDMVIKNEYMNDNAILLADEKWNTGVIGIAAAKISEKFSRPCVLFGGAEGNLVGSARSVDGINMYDVLSDFSDSFEKFGGHSQAAGLTIKPQLLDELRQKVCEKITQKYDESVFIQKKEYDLELEVESITDKLIRDIDKLAPFGHCNPKPLLLIKNAKVNSPKFIGKDNKPHLKFSIGGNETQISALNFFFKHNYSFLPGEGDFLCEAEINDYNSKAQLIVRQLKMGYNNKLKKNYIASNSMQMMRQFIDEVAMLGETNEDSRQDHEFEEALKKQMSKSRFSMCLIAGTIPAFERALCLKTVKTALLSGELLLHDRKDYHSDNCIYVSDAPGHKSIFKIGVGGFFDDKLKLDYKEYAARFFANRELLLQIYKRVIKTLLTESKTVVQLAKSIDQSLERTAFSLRVFSELKLIEVLKSGKISAAKSDGVKRELTSSRCYKSFADLMERD